MTSLTATAARGTAVTIGAQLVRFVLQLVAIVVLARLLMPEDFGLVAMVAAVIGVAEIIRDFGLSSAAIQSPTLSRDEQSNLFWANTALGAVCTGLAWAATPLVVALYDEPRLARVVPALSVVFLFSGLSTQYRVHLGRGLRFRALATADVVSHTVGTAAAIGLALGGAGLWALVAQQVVTALVALTVNAISCRWLPGRPRRSVSIRRFFRFGLALLGIQALAYGTKNIDNVALGAAWGPTTLGLYSRAYQLVMLPLNQVNTPLTRVALPVLSRLQDDDERFARAAAKAQLVGCYVTATLLAVAAGVAVPLIHVVMGPRWVGLAPIFALLAIGGVFRSISQLSYWLFLAKGKPGAQLRLDVWSQPLMMGLIVAGVPWGARGVAVTHLVAYAAYWAVGLVAVGRSTGVLVRPLFAKAALAVGTLGLPAGLAGYGGTLLFDAPWPALGAGVACAFLTLILSALLVRPVRRDLTVLASLGRQAVGRKTAGP